jgi:SAM-dependent methyltransferase
MSIECDTNGNATSNLTCVACGSARLISRGRLPVFTPDFLGHNLDSTIDPGFLYECRNCTLCFRAPQPSEEVLMAYYAAMDTVECWQHGSEREVWPHIKAALASIPDQSVLDVGCFRGDMLNYLGPDFTRYGVEPSPEAAAQAENAGVEIVGPNIHSLENSTLRPGAITLVDVAEHLPRPLESLRTLTQLLMPGGRLIIFTGNTDALSWKLAGLDYYYSGMPEHVVFMNPAWFQWAAAQLGCEVVSIERLHYQSVPFAKQIDEALKNLFYIAYHRAERRAFVPHIFFKLPLVKRVGKWPSCWWTSARDHTLVVLAKKADA